MRKSALVDSESYLNSVGFKSLTSDILLGGINPMSLIGSAGKSGAFFFYSANNQFLIKAISKAEFNSLRKILIPYCTHLKKHSRSLITRFFGLHRLQLFSKNKRKKELFICVMSNVLHAEKKAKKIYDLKGSLYKRKKGSKESKSAPFKDEDWLEDKSIMVLDKKDFLPFISTLKKDKDFLESQKLIDYSLLIGLRVRDAEEINKRQDQPYKVGRMQRRQPQPSKKNDSPLERIKTPSSGQTIQNEIVEYRVGIIDILTPFNLKKKIEAKLKRCFQGKHVSCVPPKFYAERFYQFVTNDVVKMDFNWISKGGMGARREILRRGTIKENIESEK